MVQRRRMLPVHEVRRAEREKQRQELREKGEDPNMAVVAVMTLERMRRHKETTELVQRQQDEIVRGLGYQGADVGGQKTG